MAKRTCLFFAVLLMMSLSSGCSGDKEKARLAADLAWKVEVQAMRAEERLYEMAAVTLKLAEQSLVIEKESLRRELGLNEALKKEARKLSQELQVQPQRRRK